MVLFQEDDQTTAQTACAPKTLKCPTVDLSLHTGTMLQSCLTMLVQEDYKKNPKKQQRSDTGWKTEQRRVILTDELIQKKQAGREIN